VVVKVLLEHVAEDPWVLKKFRLEKEALARLDHPGVVAPIDSGQLPDGRPFLVMQFVKGARLRDEIRPRGMDLGRVGSIVRLPHSRH
jgi:eukaryotic-like serine/threonine-protein kinase